MAAVYLRNLTEPDVDLNRGALNGERDQKTLEYMIRGVVRHR